MSHTIQSIPLDIDGGWSAIEDARFEHMWDAKEVCHQDIHVDVLTDPGFQTMAGLGASFSELGYLALASLPQDEQQRVMEALFGPTGARMTFCRVPIGASDFATDAYSHSETPDDYDMAHFSVARDETRLIPFIQAAIKVNPALRLHASPWSPPAWMKQNGQMTNGSPLIDDPHIFAAYARYLRIFVQAYADHGIEVARLVIQNEPECGKGYPSCSMRPDQMVTLAVEYLAPEFEAAGLNTEIWAGTHTRLGGLYPFHCLRDERFRKTIRGLGFQYELPEKIHDLSAAGGHLPVMHTESHCHMGLNRPVESAALYEDVWDFITAGCDNFTYWNMILDETHSSGWGWNQNSLVVIDRESGQVEFTPDHEVMKLLSASIQPGAVRLPTHCLHLRRVMAFKDPEGGVTAILYNTANAKKATVTVDGATGIEVDLPAQSLVAMNLSSE